jgi:signal transduction histidine kinase
MLGVTHDITEHKESEEARRQLLRQLVTAQEDERRRISRELHDQMGQHIVAIVLLVSSLKDFSQTEPATAAKFAQLEDVAQQLSLQVDNLAWKLRPTELDDLGLHAALINYVGKWSKRYQAPVDFQSVSLGDQRLASEIETAIYRIAQEALNNIIKHARASYISLILELRGNYAFVIIEDNGCGFDVEEFSAARAGQRRMGLLGMKERAALVGGTFNIESTPGAGTTIFVRIPLGLDKNGGHSF